MAQNTSNIEELLKRPLYVYDLPQELLSTLTTKDGDQQTPLPTDVDFIPEVLERSDKENGVATSTSCALCQVALPSFQEQRDHVRTDHHRYNLKAQLRGNKPLTEGEFNKAIGELDESISGSESSESDSEGDDGSNTPDATLTALLKRQAKISQEADEDNEEKTLIKGGGRSPLFWFTSPLLPSNTSLGIYRAIFTQAEQEEPAHLVDSLRKKQLAPVTQRRGAASSAEQGPSASALSPHVFMCMIGGGHFAAMVVSLAPEIQKRPGGVEERQARVVAHKTFHRYTTRRKQGGAQSANDSAKGAAHSAGSSLRRYNEAALEKEIRELLGEWKDLIDNAQLLFVRATGSTNRRILFGPYDGQVLRQNDSRLRGFPFNTRRATQGELLRSFKELSRVKVSHVDEAAIAAAENKRREEAAKPQKRPAHQEKPKISSEDEAAMLHTSQIQALIRRSKAPALASYISNNSIPSSFRFYPPTSSQNFHSPTPLHLAASSNSPAIVLALLTKANADPTILNGEGKTAFDIAGDRATRDAFRVARHELGESRWNWEAAHVPAPVSKAEADSSREQERKAAEEAEANRRKAELERLKKEEDAAREAASRKGKKPGGRALGAVEKTGAEKREEEMRGMTPEMRMRLERERRARAAEERIRKMQGR